MRKDNVILGLVITFLFWPTEGLGDDVLSQVITKKFPSTLVTNRCEYVEQNSQYAYVDLFIAIVVHGTVGGGEIPKPMPTNENGPVLIHISCGMKPGAIVDPTSKCRGATLELRNLINGEPLTSTNLNPMQEDWDDSDFYVQERTGSLFRITSKKQSRTPAFIMDGDKVPPMTNSIVKTFSVDFTTRKVSYHSNRTVSYDDGSLPNKVWEDRAESVCESDGWTATGPKVVDWKSKH